MDVYTQVDRWIKEIEKPILTYQEGYFELPCLSASPLLMIESLKRIPFNTYDTDKRIIHTKSIFAEGLLYYREITEGLWLLVSEMHFKKPLALKARCNNAGEYYFIHHFRYQPRRNKITLNKVPLQGAGWSVIKPGTDTCTNFHSGEQGLFISLAFNQSWLNKNLYLHILDDDNSFKNFLNSDSDLAVFDNIVPEAEGLSEEVLKVLKEADSSGLNHLHLSIAALNLLAAFLKGISKYDESRKTPITNADKKALENVEKIISNCLTSSFPGIEFIAREVHLSPTKLKTLFKANYGKAIYQYYQEKQMLLAYELLKDKQNSVKQVALLLGYENPSNFRNAFKKFHGFNPSLVL